MPIEHQPRDEGDKPELHVDDEHGREIERRQRRIEQQQHRRAGDEIAHVVQAAHRLHVAAADVRARNDARNHRPADDRLEAVGQRAQHLAAEDVDQRQYRDERDRQHRQHEQCVEAAAGQHAVGKLKQIQRQRQHQQVDEDREGADGGETALGDRTPATERIGIDARTPRRFVR